jgi:hypothetical protein
MSEKTKKYFKKNASKNTDRLTDRDIETVNKLTQKLKEPAAIGSGVGAAAAIAADLKGSTDPYLSRNEFKEGFYEQPSKPPTTAETMYGKGTKRGFESPTVDPDTSMMQNMAEGGSVRGQKNIQVKKKQFKGIF